MCIENLYTRYQLSWFSFLPDNKLIPYQIKVYPRILSDISSLPAKPYELKHNRYRYVFTTVFPIGILFPVESVRFTLKNERGIDTLSERKGRDIDLPFHATFPLYVIYAIAITYCNWKRLRDTGSWRLNRSVWNESNVDSNDINWRAQLGTEPLLKIVTRWNKTRSRIECCSDLELARANSGRRRFDEIINFGDFIGRRKKHRSARLKRKINYCIFVPRPKPALLSRAINHGERTPIRSGD